MCGILGHLAFHPDHRISESLLNSLNQLLNHRGPDAEGTYMNGDIALAMKRLSIIDLQGGVQPVISNDNRYILECLLCSTIFQLFMQQFLKFLKGHSACDIPKK